MSYDPYAFIQPVVDKLFEWTSGAIAMLPNLLLSALIFDVAVLVARQASRLVLSALNRFSDNEQINRLLSTSSRVALLIAGGFWALEVLQLDEVVTSLLAGVGIVGLALGFAFQDIAANFMAGILIIPNKDVYGSPIQDYTLTPRVAST